MTLISLEEAHKLLHKNQKQKFGLITIKVPFTDGYPGYIIAGYHIFLNPDDSCIKVTGTELFAFV